MQFKTLLLLLLVPSLSLSSVVLPRTFGSWTIKNFSRSCPNPNMCTYDCIISTPSGDQQCTIVDSNTPALFHPFYDIPCNQTSQYHVSWGWDYPGNFTVMTILKLNQPNGANTKAYFGYKAPNDNIPPTGGSATYTDVGPNAVEPQ